MTTLLSEKQSMKLTNEPAVTHLHHQRIKTKTKKTKRKPTIHLLTRKQLENIRTPIFIKTFNGELYMYIWSRLHSRGIPRALNLKTLKSIPLKELYYDIRHVRIADTTSENHQIIARRKQADNDLLIVKGMKHIVVVSHS
jgi:hypothetical protein